MSSIKVQKVAGSWRVCCSACTSDSMFDLLIGSWISATTQRVAMILAHWHAALHAEQRCKTCLHVPPLPRPVIVDSKEALLRLDGQLYTVTAAGVRAMEPTP